MNDSTLRQWRQTIKQFDREAKKCPRQHLHLLEHLSCPKSLLIKKDGMGDYWKRTGKDCLFILEQLPAVIFIYLVAAAIICLILWLFHQ